MAFVIRKLVKRPQRMLAEYITTPSGAVLTLNWKDVLKNHISLRIKWNIR